MRPQRAWRDAKRRSATAGRGSGQGGPRRGREQAHGAEGSRAARLTSSLDRWGKVGHEVLRDEERGRAVVLRREPYTVREMTGLAPEWVEEDEERLGLRGIEEKLTREEGFDGGRSWGRRRRQH
ncbi:hypothetical protein GQ55_7G005600 [Panicum hallii var. hallii]|uniref:Uncharacterized protein n=1 Tax=Panicum hallii var. hallii TaxID=1504633 RepID=A0A2T7CRK6_9POAL|nr:hypothetical protein GQ55_7G005600 [Panicum hallii var. hallii]